MEIKTLTVNGQTYTIADPDALHEQDIAHLVSVDQEQPFTEAQKARARHNIGAITGTATIENGILVVGAASVKNNILIMS